MVDLLFLPDADVLTTKGIIKTLYDPACGTGGMLSVAESYVRELNPDARLEVFGQDYNAQAYAICGSDMLIKGHNIDHIAFGDSFTEDRFPDKKFDYMRANPPFGVKWEAEAEFIKREHEEQGFGGRFGAGLPRINDGSLLFLQHMISKMKAPKEGGTRLGIVFNGSPLFTGGAGSGESEIRRWIIENDWLEGIVALPDQLFYNTGIYTYLWIVTNRKERYRRGKVQLVDARAFFKKMRKSLGQKRHEICEDQRAGITRLYGEFKENEYVKIFDNEDLGYRRITVERPLRLNFAVTEERLARVREAKPFVNLATSKKRKDKKEAETEIAEGKKLQESILSALEGLTGKGIVKNRGRFTEMVKEAFREAGIKVPASLFKAVLMALSERDETADICTDSKGNPESDPELRDYENVPLKEDVQAYFEREVLPHVPDAWIDHSKTKVGYEINFNRYFYKYPPSTAGGDRSGLKENREGDRRNAGGGDGMRQRMTENAPADVIGKLREALASFKNTDIYKEIVEPRDAVLARFQPVFAPDHVTGITEEEFRSFLLDENNHHWSGLHRTGPRMCADMDRLRDALAILVDENQPVADRLDKAIGMVPGMGKNVATAILLVTQPDRYGVWNNRSEATMKRLGIWPEFGRGEPFGSRYVKVNQILLQLRDALQTDLWTLDALWWYLDQKESGDISDVRITDLPSTGAPAQNELRFGLERHLHEFLRDNWDRLELGREWALYQEPGDEEAGYEYPCDVGRIDLLARHKREPRWLVVELKRNQTSDQTVGQLLRYIGWVKQHLAEDGDVVHGMIICREADDALHYALSTLPNVELRLYKVEFHLKKPEAILGTSRRRGGE